MKKKLKTNGLVAMVILFVTAISANAQTINDSTEIRKICADYVEGFYTQDAARMKGALHSELVKRIIDNRSGKSVIHETSREELASYLKPEYKMEDTNPSVALQTKVIIYDIESDIALAKIATNKMVQFFDYVQLGKIDGKWQIINVLWAYYKR
jgi:Putative lumazine-binding